MVVNIDKSEVFRFLSSEVTVYAFDITGEYVKNLFYETIATIMSCINDADYVFFMVTDQEKE